MQFLLLEKNKNKEVILNKKEVSPPYNALDRL